MSQSQKEAAEYAEVLLAYSRGERIEMRLANSDAWKAPTYPLWDFGRFEYRVAPKPVESWMRWNGANDNCAYSEKQGAENAAREMGGRAILMREVVE